MKLATKKFFHNVLAIAVSVCMICTLTPSAAWATSSSSDPFYDPTYTTSGSGDVSESDGSNSLSGYSETASGKSSATGSTEIKAKLLDSDFAFTYITPGKNYVDKKAFADSRETYPLLAKFKKSSLPEKYTATWSIWEREENPDYPDDSDEPTKLVDGAYTTLSTVTAYDNVESDGTPIFTLDQAGYDAAVAFMEDGKIYEFSIVLKDDNDASKEGKAATNVTLFPNYKNIPVYGSGAMTNSSLYMVQGDIFVTAKLWPLDFAYPELSVASVTQSSNSALYGALQAEAGKKGEELGTVAELNLTGLSDFPQDKGPYLSDPSSNQGLMVDLPLPDDTTVEEGGTVTVYAFNQTAGESEATAKAYTETEVFSVLPEDGKPGDEYLAAGFLIQGTGATLGTYALGTPMSGSYKIYASADEGGMISPGGNDSGLISGQPLGKEAEFFALPYTTGYALAGYTVEVGDTAVAQDKLTISGNSLKFLPSACGIKDGDTVYVHAKFDEVTNEATCAVTATLRGTDGATGSMYIAPAQSYEGAPAEVSIGMNKADVKVGNVKASAGLLINFDPGNDYIVDYVKVNDKDLAFNYASNEVLIGALTGDTDIQVGYRKKVDGDPDASTLPKVDVTGEIDRTGWPSGVIRAMLGIGSSYSRTEFSHAYPTPSGTSQTISIKHSRDYRVEATQVDSKGVEVDVTNKMTTSDSVDSITLYNVTNEVTVKFNYVPKETTITGTGTGGGSGEIVIDPNNPGSSNSTKASSAKAKARARTAASRANETWTITGGDQLLAEGGRARIVAYPEAGNQISRIEVNGTNVTQYFSQERRRDNGTTCYTLTVYRTDSGYAPDDAGRWLMEGWDDEYEEIPDYVLPIESSTLKVTMLFAPKVPTSNAYRTITTHVEGVGGAITPSFKAEAKKDATVQFFPDDTYKVKEYRVVDGRGTKVKEGTGGYECTFPVDSYDLDVYVSFEAGSSNLPKMYTITPQASSKGVISPGEPVKVYEGSSFSFSILARTGYIAEEPTLTGTVNEHSFTGYTYTLSGIQSDCTLTPVFASSDDERMPTHTVTTKVGEAGGGTIKPAGPFTVADGSNASFTFFPDDGWYVKGVYATDEDMEVVAPDEDDESIAHGINLVGTMTEGRMFTLSGIQADTQLEVVFAKLSDLSDDERNKHTPPALNDGDTFTLNPTEAANLGPGATISPNLADMEFIVEKGSDPIHAASGTDITIIVASGYQLDDSKPHGGITVTNGKGSQEKDVTDKVTVKPAGDGLYAVTIPAENVTPDMKITVETASTKATAETIAKASVTVTSNDNGTVSPSGTIQVEEGNSQTFSFIPEKDNKLYRLYVNDKLVTITGNTYTMHNIRGNNTVHAVFVPQEGAVKPATVPVTVTGGAHGSVEPSGSFEVVSGASLSILTLPDAGYKVVATKNGTPLSLVGNTIELTDITSACNIAVSFVADTDAFYTLSVGCNDGGSVSPAGNTLLANGARQTISILPDAGKAVKEVVLKKADGSEDLVSATAIPPNVSNVAEKTGITYTTPAAEGNMSVYVVFCDSTESRDPNLPTGDELRSPDPNTTYRTVTALVRGGGGAVVPNTSRVANGSKLTLTIVPLDGYKVATASFNDSPVVTRLDNNGTTFVADITKDSVFEVSFEKSDDKAGLEQYYTVFANVLTDGGSISPAGPVVVSAGGSQSFTIMPDPNYKVSSINIKEGDVVKPAIKDFKGSTYTLFNVNSNITFNVSFAKVDIEHGETPPAQFMTHTITASSSVNGSISPAGSRSVAHGGDAMFSFIPWDGYKLSYIIVDGVNVRARNITNMQFTFPNVTEDHTIQAVFIGDNEKADDFVSVNVSTPGNGTLSPVDNVLINKGSQLVIDVTPFYGYEVDAIEVTPLGGSTIDLLKDTYDKNLYTWGNGQLTLKSVEEDMGVVARFKSSDSGSPDPSNAPNYGKLESSVSGNGTTSIQPNPIYFEQPGAGTTAAQKEMDITIVPGDGQYVKEVTVSYGDKSKTVYDETGKHEYDKNGSLVSESSSPTAKDIYRDGYVTVDTDRGDVSLDVKFGTDVNYDKNTPQATYYDVNVTYSAGGTVGPAGTIKVAQGANLTLQMIPSNGYTIASVNDNGENKTSAVTSTRTYIMQNVQSNRTVNVNFGFKNPEEGQEAEKPHTFEVNVVAGQGTVSPAEAKVRDGATQVVYFFPAEGYKIGSVNVKRGSDSTPLDNFNSPSYTVRNITTDVTIDVEYVEGKESWTTKAIPLKVSVGAGESAGCYVSPTYSELPVGAAAEVSFYPAHEWRASYYTLNGKTYNLPQNVSSWPVMPDATDGAENEMVVFFERLASSGVDQIVNVQLVEAASTPGCSAAPSQATVAYGGSTTFYVYPDLINNYTIDYVRFNGVDQAYEPVVNGESSQQTGSYSNGRFTASGSAAGNPKTFSNVYKVTLNDVVTSGTLEIKFRKIDSKDDGPAIKVMTNKHKLTVTSMGGGMVSPIGEVYMPAGETVDILTTSFESYYLYKVIKTEGGKTTDLTADVQDRVAKVIMPDADCKVEVTFNRVGESIADINVSRGKMTYDGQPIEVEIGGYINDEGKPDAAKINEDGVLCSLDGTPIAYKRGSAYEFYFNPTVTGKNGRPLVISKAYYAGKEVSIIPNATYLTNVVLNASGAFDLEFRELEEGEQLLNPSEGYTVAVEVIGGGRVATPVGIVPAPDAATGLITVQPGGSTGAITFLGSETNENLAVASVTLWFKDEYTHEYVKQQPPVPSTEYADGSYNFMGVSCDAKIVIEYADFTVVRVEWDNSLGFITPNHKPGECIYVETEKAELPFYVAPYEGNELVSVETGASWNSLSAIDLREDNENGEFKNVLDQQVGANAQNGGITTMSVADRNPVVVQPQQTSWAKVYQAPVSLGSTETANSVYVRANFKAPNAAPHYIHASVKNGHGSLNYEGDIEVPHGGNLTITASPDVGYAVVGLTVDNVSRTPKISWPFENVTEDHTIVFEFGLPGAYDSSSSADRLVRVASKLAQTGDLTGPVVGLLLLVAAAGLGVTAVSYIRRQQRRRRRMQGMQ